jgi:hypothetical protein
MLNQVVAIQHDVDHTFCNSASLRLAGCAGIEPLFRCSDHAFYNAPECIPFFQERESILSGPSQQFSVSGDTDFSQSRSENIGEYE